MVTHNKRLLYLVTTGSRKIFCSFFYFLRNKRPLPWPTSESYISWTLKIQKNIRYNRPSESHSGDTPWRLRVCSDLLAEREENVSLRIANAQLEGKAAFYDLFIDLEHSTNLRTTAKELDVPERRFVRFLLEKRFVYRTASGNVLPYAKPANEGLFCVKDYCNHGHTGSYTLITPQGGIF